ncbi:MAG: hypothetical protein ACI89D_002249, partial [Bermanella sp.]
CCNPYWADCISISRSGRHGLVYFIFKSSMLLAALMLAIFWQLNAIWLRSLGAPLARQWILPAIGWRGTGGLYPLTWPQWRHLPNPSSRWRRNILGLIFIGFALLAGTLKRSPLHFQRLQLQTGSAAILALALTSILLDALLGDGYDRLENAFEWWLVAKCCG